MGPLRLPRVWPAGLLPVLLFSPSTTTLALPVSGGWTLLHQNRNVQAQTAFRAALRKQPSDAVTLRGLALVNMLEDRTGDALQNWRAAVRVDPAGWQAGAWWPTLVELAQDHGRWDLLEGAAQDILAAKGASSELRASARLVKADGADRRGRTVEADAEWARMGYIRQWRVCGPFDNISRSGLDKPYPPELGLDAARSCRGKDDQVLRWHPLAIMSRDGQCEVAQALGDQGESVFYGATAVYSPREQPVWLHMDPTGASKVWLNGRALFHDAVYRVRRRFVADPFRVEARLRSGWNTLLVKVADESGVEGSFAARFTTTSGTDLSELRIDPAHVAVARVDADSPLPQLEPATTARIRAHLPDPEAVATLARWQAGTGDYEAAIETLRTALERMPEAGWLRQELWEALRADRQRDEARAERDAACARNPRLVTLELDRLEEERQALPPADMIKRLKALLQINPQSERIIWALQHTYEQAKMTGEALQAARRAVALVGGEENVEQLARIYAGYEREGDAETVLAQALQKNPCSETLHKARAERLVEAGKMAAAIAEYTRLSKINTPWPEYGSALAALYRASKDDRKALATLQTLRAQRPQDGEICAQLGDVWREVGRKKEAIACYREAVRLDPSQAESRDKLQLLTGERPVMDLVPATPVGPILAAAKTAKADGASAIVFLDEARQVLYPDFATVSRYHQIIKVFDQSAVERYQSYPLPRPEASSGVLVEQARILKADGKVQDVTHSERGADDGEGHVALPSLAAGDVIDITYRILDYRRGALSKQFWAQWLFTIPDAPVKLSRFVLVSPPELRCQTRDHGAVPKAITTTVKGWSVQEWRMTDVPAYRMERMGTSARDAGIWLDLSTVASWTDIVRWYRDLSRPRCEPDRTVRAKANELTRGAHTQEEKIRALIAFVRGIQYQTTPFRMSAYVPTEGKRVLQDGYADCKDKAALLTALLAAVDIRSDMVLLNGRHNGLAPYLPSPRFDHAIAVVHTEKGPLWVDTTADQMEIGGFPCEDQGVPALIINEEATDLSATPALPVEADRLEEQYTMTLAEDGRLSGAIETEARGNWAWLMRTVFRSVPATKQEEVLRSIAAQTLKGGTYDGGSIEGLADLDSPFVLRLKIHIDNYSAKAGNLMLVRLPWNLGEGNVDSLLTAGTRTQDAELAAAREYAISTVRVKLPAGYVVQDLPPATAGESAWGSYHIRYRVDGDVLIAVCEARIPVLRIPARDVPAYVEFVRGTSREGSRQFVLKKP